MGSHSRHDASATCQDIQQDAAQWKKDAAGHREPATRPARRHPAGMQEAPTDANLAPEGEVEPEPPRLQRTRKQGRKRRIYEIEWGWWYAALVMLALAVATTLPRAHGFLEIFSTWCGDGVCEPRLEKADWCAVDCLCGDGVCDDSEAVSASCPKDCLSHVDIAQHPSQLSRASLAFYQQPVVKISNAARLEAYTPGSVLCEPSGSRCCTATFLRSKTAVDTVWLCTGTVTATLYTVIDDPTGTKRLNVPVVDVRFFYDFLWQIVPGVFCAFTRP